MTASDQDQVESESAVMVVVVAFGPPEQLADCLNTLGPTPRVVVVDNGRSEEVRDICLTRGTLYLLPEANLGFAGAVNLAIRKAREPGCDVLLLNPDAHLDPRDLTLMQQGLHRSDDIAAVGPQLVNPDGSTQKVVWPIPSPWTALASVVGAADSVSRRHFVSGAVLLLRGEAIDQVGPFDERFFMYAEETDWQLRAIRAGWRVEMVEEALAVHMGGGTSSDAEHRQLLFDASAERFTRKWYGRIGWQVLRVASILAALRRLLSTRDPESKLTQRRAIAHYVHGPVRCADAAIGNW
jgi:GT2 family glycosyltransferase